MERTKSLVTREREDEEEKEEDKIVCARHIDTKCNK
jgi:hypothetical protein